MSAETSSPLFYLRNFDMNSFTLMVIVSVLTPLLAALTQWLTTSLLHASTWAMNWMQKPKEVTSCNEVLLVQTQRMNMDRGYDRIDQDETSNGMVIQAVLAHLTSLQPSLSCARINLREDGRGSSLNEQFKTRSLFLAPQQSVQVEGIDVSYEKLDSNSSSAAPAVADSKGRKSSGSGSGSGSGSSGSGSGGSAGGGSGGAGAGMSGFNGTIVHRMRLSSEKRGVYEIRDFIRRCYDAYVDRIYPLVSEEKRFYVYQQVASRRFDQFTLPMDEHFTTFDDLFFAEKPDVLNLLEQLRLHKLRKVGLLLYGEPGTGKSSLIRAIMHKTRRHVILVKLSMIESDRDLLRLFFDERIILQDTQDCRYCPLNERIYVFEDIDAETDIIRERQTKSAVAEKPDTDTASGAGAGVGVGAAAGKLDGAGAGARAGSASDRKTMLISPYTASVKASDIIEDAGGHYGSVFKKQFTLSGFLNALDGIMQLQDAVIVMTTNHPDHVDEAVFRYGRVNLKIHMQKLCRSYADAMIRKFFQGTSVREEYLPQDYLLTPAHLESLCQKATSIEHLERLLCMECERERESKSSEVTLEAMTATSTNAIADTNADAGTSTGTSTSAQPLDSSDDDMLARPNEDSRSHVMRKRARRQPPPEATDTDTDAPALEREPALLLSLLPTA